ncbi:DUF300-domain-containing protein [Coniophora puteana RWD-64-598 SS2]|uniref:DUF300-domain-containing protein n=1 Tax=Coniophora puteana (strain RWD-64-598) TaxID=741705 RepID=R7SDI0_CONPW|nr:DUF300-domain-containing protein [Coniophora puteana RWD-64-598 SS2]EIW74213.1 DUF300-domain-containing protein [Coniophora puteana RWD-64-598 SS2]
MLTSDSCPSENTQTTDQSSFWNSDSLHWDEHRIGWAIAGGCAALTLLISMFSVLQHCRNYTRPHEQRQILRILYMPPVYAIISFFSYRFFRTYDYYSLIEAAYEAVTLSAFLMLLIEYVANTATGHSAEKALVRKDKTRLLFPLCFWRYRPTKAYFMYTLKWSVLQYVIIRPAVSIAGIVTNALGVLCPAGPYSIHFAEVYLEAIDFVSISIALYGLLLFYALTKEELAGRRPLAKFLSIKLIVMLTFYQSFVFTTLEGRVIKPTEYWTATNIANGLTALTICIEMVFFSAFMCWAFTAGEYKTGEKTSIGKPLLDSINYGDFFTEIWGSMRFFFAYALRRPGTHTPNRDNRPDFGEAFGVDGAYRKPLAETGAVGGIGGGGEFPIAIRPRTSYDENIRLAPYPYTSASRSASNLDVPV